MRFNNNCDEDIYEIAKSQIKNLIELAELRKTDVFYDLGSGRGHVIRMVVKHVRRAIGIESERKYYEVARKLAQKELSNIELRKLEFWVGEFNYVNDDYYVYDLSDATIIYNSLIEEDEQEVNFYKTKLKHNVRIIKKDLPLVGFRPINSNKNSKRCWFFLMNTPLWKYRIKSKNKWAQLVLGKEDATINDVYDYFIDLWTQRGENDDNIDFLEKLVRKRLPLP